MRPLGILGGTFDPIHYGHLRPADEVRRRMGLAQVNFIPASQPPHRATPRVSATHRLRMVELGVAEFSGLAADGRELARPGPSYTVDTLRALRAEVGDRPLCLLMGVDAFLGVPSWHEWQALPELAHLLVMHRPAHAMSVLPNWAQARRHDDPAALASCPAGVVQYVSTTPVDISATAVRERLRRGESVDGDVPTAVLDYIRTHGLYTA